jgi:hypothetical protein
MDHQNAIDRILALEEACEVEAIRYKGLRLWPYIRLLLWARMLNPGRFAPAKEIGLHQWACHYGASFAEPKSYAAYVRHLEAHHRQIAALAARGRTDLLFFSRVEDHADRFDGRSYNRHIDPMIDLVRGAHRFLKLELATAGAAQTVPRFEPTIFHDSVDFVRYDARRSLIQSFRAGEPVPGIEGIDGFFAELNRLEPGFPLNREQVYIEAEQIVHFKGYFREMLGAVRPRAVFAVCYYYDLAMALLAACREMGITSVDVQHGKQGKVHGMYTHWQRVPAEGYDLLPDVFWTWGEESKQNIEKWMPPAVRGHHQVTIGGNRWLAKWAHRDTEVLRLAPDEQEALLRLDQESQVVLVSLQPVTPILPEWLFEAIEKAPAMWKWLLRLHPHQRDQLEACEAFIRHRGLVNVDLREATRLPLYALLQRAHRHVTQWSTVGYEALAFGVPTVIVGDTGAALFDADIRQGRFQWASDGATLVERLQDRVAGGSRRGSVYIETDDALAHAALADVWNDRRRGSTERISGWTIEAGAN